MRFHSGGGRLTQLGGAGAVDQKVDAMNGMEWTWEL